MVDREVLVQKWQELRSKRFFLPLLFVFGFICSIFEPVIRSVSGHDVADSIWPYAYRTLQWTLFLRENVVLFTFAMSVLLFFTFIVLQRQFGGKDNPQWLSSFCTFGLGVLSGFIVLFFALDIF